MLLLVNSLLFAFSTSGILFVFLLNPLMIWIVYLIKGKKAVSYSTTHPSVSLITVFHDGEDLIVDKIKNCLSLNYPSENYEIIFFSDGPSDGTKGLLKPFIDKRVRFLSSPTYEGKAIGINKAVQHSSGEIIIFSDVDAILGENAIIGLVNYFNDPEVGGVCGERVIYENKSKLMKAQSVYIRFDSFIKRLESQIGSISSNDGKVYAIRRDLFQMIPPAVTDDLYECLSIVRQNRHFLFEPDVKAFVKAPSRSPAHEIERRRRIVSTSLRGIYLMRGLLNPFKYGLFSIRLIINKVIRRLLPICLLVMFISSVFLASYSPIITMILFLQIAFYVLAFCYRALFQYLPFVGIITRITSVTYYFCLANYGSFLGLLDFAMGRKITRWKPVKTG